MDKEDIYREIYPLIYKLHIYRLYIYKIIYNMYIQILTFERTWVYYTKWNKSDEQNQIRWRKPNIMWFQLHGKSKIQN